MFYLEDYATIIEEVKANNAQVIDKSDNNARQVIVPKDEALLRKLAQQVDAQKEQITDNISILAYPDEDKAFLQLYLRYLLANVNLDSIDTQYFKTSSTDFTSRYAQSPYQSFIEQNINLKYKQSHWNIGWGVLTGYSFWLGDLSTYFKGFVPIGGSIDVGYNRLNIVINFVGSLSSKTKKAFTTYNADSTQNADWSKGQRVSVVRADVNLGYTVLSNTKFKVVPYAGLGTTAISTLTEIEDTVPSIRHTPSFAAGVLLDYKFSYTNKDPKSYEEAFIVEKDRTYWYARLNLALVNPMYSEDYKRFKGKNLYVGASIGICINPAMKVK
ncbi:MAG: hypothetical protein HC896_15580 [Bacteroidales bacterium]|nr:hypothetical protein [Bacteroidales bacterium]